MDKRRKAAEQSICDFVEAILPGGGNSEMYRTRFSQMDDAEFERLMHMFQTGETAIAVVVPNGSKVKLSTKRNLEYAKKIGHDFFPKLILTDPGVGVTYKTPIPYFVADLTLRRQAQTMEKKRSIPEKITNIDQMTDQPTGASKGAKISFTELQYMRAQGLNLVAEEYISIRGGNMKAFNAMRRNLISNGSVSQTTVRTAGGKVKSSQTLSILLKAQHIDNNLV